MFLARLPSIFKRSHKMPHLPRNLHLVATWRSPDNKIRKKHAAPHASSAAPAMQNDDDGLQSVAPATKNATHLLKTSQKYCACHIKRPFHTLRNTSERTYHRHGHMALRTVADGYERFRNVERTHPQPLTPRVKREPLLRIRKLPTEIHQTNWAIGRCFCRCFMTKMDVLVGHTSIYCGWKGGKNLQLDR